MDENTACITVCKGNNRDNQARNRYEVYNCLTSPRCHTICRTLSIVLLPGAVLVGIGMGYWSPSVIGKTILTTAGIAVYIFGVIYFVVINLADQSCEQEEEDDLSTSTTSETVDTMDSETLTHEIGQGDCATLV
ncbi:hypothetical protein ACROYT_G012228 [Oculina patagonica]